MQYACSIIQPYDDGFLADDIMDYKNVDISIRYINSNIFYIIFSLVRRVNRVMTKFISIESDFAPCRACIL